MTRSAVIAASLLHIASPLVAEAGTSSEREVVRITVQIGFSGPPKAGAAPVLSQVVATPLTKKQSEGARGAEVAASGPVPGEYHLALQPDLLYQIQIRAKGFWAPPVQVLVPAGEAGVPNLTIQLYPLGLLRGTFDLTATENRPSALSVRWQPSLAGDDKPQGTIPCSVEDVRWSCEVPAGRLDLRLRVPGHSSLFLWDVEVAAHESLALDQPFVLRPGASLVGWLRTEDGSSIPTDGKVVIAPEEAVASPDAPSAQRQRFLERSARVNEEGFFAFEGIDPGSYRLTATASGFAPSVLPSVRVVSTSETEVREISLHRPASLLVMVPPTGDPLLEVLELLLIEQGSVPGRARPVARGKLDPSGNWAVEGLTPGRHVLQLVDPGGDVLHSEETEVAAGQNQMVVELDVVVVNGDLDIGGEPLSGRLVFGGPGTPSRITMFSDADGRFSGILPREGTWVVQVESVSPRVSRTVRGVQVERRTGRSEAEVTIHLPAGRLAGRVVDGSGKRIGKAVVTAVDAGGEDGASSSTADDAGEFDFLGITAGTWLLTAEASRPGQHLLSDITAVTLAEDEVVEDLQLVVRGTRRFTGTVQGVSGPVSGAFVKVLAEAGSVAIGSQTRSDVEGRFAVDVPADSTGLFLTVMPPGHALHGERYQVEPGELDVEVAVEVNSVWGAIELHLPAEIDWSDPSSARPVLLQQDVFFDWATLLRWADLHRGTEQPEQGLVVPAVEPGTYTACLLRPDATLTLNDFRSLDIGDCTTGFLPPSGTLELRLSGPAEEPGLGGPGAR